FCKTMGYKGVTFSGFQTINGQKAPIYHTNVMLTIAENFAIVFLNAVENEIEKNNLKNSIINSGKELIEIS
ncbi:arginine deiminase-related protein, partial [Acinetobacter baumannii]|nr:arginine deiminase-related protein [Acinetobacter baumannii]